MLNCLDTVTLWANRCTNLDRRKAIKGWAAAVRSNEAEGVKDPGQ
jgi:hypothetical protein